MNKELLQQALCVLTNLINSACITDPQPWRDARKDAAQCITALEAAMSPPADSTPELRVGDSSFEDWYQTYPRQGISKQIARDAYAAGMGDPLVTYAQSVQKSVQQMRQLGTSIWQECDADGETCLKRMPG